MDLTLFWGAFLGSILLIRNTPWRNILVIKLHVLVYVWCYIYEFWNKKTSELHKIIFYKECLFIHEIAHYCFYITWMNMVQFFISDCSVTPENWRHCVWSQEAGRHGSSLRGCPQWPSPGFWGTRTRVKNKR